ncbi:C-type lectin domain family 4 member F [Orycteropus afer afer]|uniref:C-type lectin domain family 4 member F n=1 Tax=Orycteropus afer afer TaxID=1230840 RepID=A0A8B6ZRJ2_ORYAF|nr:C-type lectin domain family 4 member F [Orycteropus afer afer]
MNDDRVFFCTDNQCVSLHPRGMDSEAKAPAARKASWLALVALVFTAVTLVSCLVALFAMGPGLRVCADQEWGILALQHPRPADPSFAKFQNMGLGDNTTEQLPVDLDGPYHFFRVSEMQEAIQMLKDHVENSSTWSVEIQVLKCSVDNVSSQIQMLSGHLENTSADIQMVKGELTDAKTLSIQTQMLRSSLEGANAEIHRLKGDLEKTHALNSQTQSFLKNSSESTSIELHTLSRGLENASTDIQILKAGLATANAQTLLVNSSLENTNAQIFLLRDNLNSVNILRTQSQALRNSLEGATSEIQKLKGGLQNTDAANSQMQTFVRVSLEKTSAEIQLLIGQLEKASDEIHSLRKDLEKAKAESQMTNSSLEQTNAQVQVLKTELTVTNALNSQIQVLNGHLKNASREIQTLKQGMRDAAALKARTQTLGSSLQKVNAEIQRLKRDLENTKTLTAKIQEEQGRLETLYTTFASQEQLQRTQNQLLQLILEGWKVYSGNLYYFSNEKKSWDEAERFCVSERAHLASVTSEEEQTFLRKSTDTFYHWIGLTDRGTEGSWRWVDGTPFSASQSKVFWGRNQPDNWLHNNGQTEDCVHMQQMWNDILCDTPYHWVCKKPIGQSVA